MSKYIDNYSINQYPTRNEIVITLPQSWDTMTNTLVPVSDRRSALTDAEETALLLVVKAMVENNGCEGCKHEMLSPAQQWIPCTEQLPKRMPYHESVSEWCLVTHFRDIFGKKMYLTEKAYLCFSDEQWHVRGNYVLGDVLAWMPLPEPYKEGE